MYDLKEQTGIANTCSTIPNQQKPEGFMENTVYRSLSSLLNHFKAIIIWCRNTNQQLI